LLLLLQRGAVSRCKAQRRPTTGVGAKVHSDGGLEVRIVHEGWILLLLLLLLLLYEQVLLLLLLLLLLAMHEGIMLLLHEGSAKGRVAHPRHAHVSPLGLKQSNKIV
jgi:hypothetical protein